MRARPLNLSANAVSDGSGKATVSLGPQIGQRWRLSNAGVKQTPANPTKFPLCTVYMGATPTDDNFIDATYTGNNDATGKVDSYPLTSGQRIFAVWTDGDPNVVCTLSIYGIEETEYR